MSVTNRTRVFIRPLTEVDLDSRMDEINDLDRVLSSAGGYITRKDLMPIIHAEFTVMFGAFDTETHILVGMVAAVRVPQPHQPTKWLLEDLAVLPEYQNHGIGRLLVVAVIMQAKVRHATKLDLTTRYERGIVAWYETFGFRRRDIRPGVELPENWRGESAYMRMNPTSFDTSALDTTMISLTA